MSRSASEAERVWKVASGTWETCGAKASAGVVQRIEGELGNRFELVVNREKAKLLDMAADKSALSFLGYKFLNRKSQRRYRLKYAETYYGELQKLGLIALTRRRYR